MRVAMACDDTGAMTPPTPRPGPIGGTDLPRLRLFDGPSPLHRLPRLPAALGGRADLWIKREDLLPLAFGGNKLRNLEFLVGAGDEKKPALEWLVRDR